MIRTQKNRVTVRLLGGLGNQMFQYAVGRALSIRCCARLALDISWFDDKNNTTRPCLLDKFPIRFEINNKYFSNNMKYHILFSKILRKLDLPPDFCTSYIREPYFHYWNRFSMLSGKSLYLDGYWQSEKYFLDIVDVIRKDFTFPNFTNKGSQDIKKKIEAIPNSVSVHIRRGDYVQNKDAYEYHYIDFSKYYQKSLNYIYKCFGYTTLFVFSDDPDWVYTSFDCCGHDKVIVDVNNDNNSYDDMHLMSLCKHHVIANSSFSWWGAWLGNNKGITIAPSRWFAKADKNIDDIYAAGWIKIAI